MKKFFSNSFVIGFLVLMLFRMIFLLTYGNSEDGNFIVLTLAPFLVFSGITYLIKRVHKTISEQ